MHNMWKKITHNSKGNDIDPSYLNKSERKMFGNFHIYFMIRCELMLSILFMYALP